MSKSYDFGSWHFDKQKDLDINVKMLLKESPRNVEFENEFFKKLINTYHKGVRYAGLKVTKFKIIGYEQQTGKWMYARERFRGNIMVTGYFEPVGEWHGVTLYPYKKQTVKSKLIEALRQRWAEKAPTNDSQICEECRVIPYPQLHHDNISFKEIMEKCMSFFTEKELEIGIGADWWKHESPCDAISSNHPAVIEMFRLHEDVTYRWLCDGCHKEAHHKIKEAPTHGNN